MSEISSPRRVLHLVMPGLSPVRREELDRLARGPGTEIFLLTEENGREALEKIFAADTVAVWGELL